MNKIPMHKKLRMYIKDHKIKQRDIATKLDTNETNISAYLTGQNRIAVDRFDDILDVIGVDWNTIKDYEGLGSETDNQEGETD